MNLPTLLNEEQICPFSYYWEGEVRPGMSVNGRLFALLECFAEEKRAIAYEQGCQLAEDHDVVITATRGSNPQYHLWIALSSGTDKTLLSYAGKCCRCTDLSRSTEQTLYSTSSPA